jgi:hypothetical protein
MELLVNLLKDEEFCSSLENIDEPYEEVKVTRRERKQNRKINPEDIRGLYQKFNHGLRNISSNKLKNIGYEATDNEINVLILIWFNEYLNEGGTFLNVPNVLKNKK